MNKKNNVKKTAALLLSLALVAGSVGCNFILTDSEKDLAQTVATVDISAALENDETYGDVAEDVAKVVGNLSSNISKRDLVAYFLNTGYQYVESYGYSYKDTFNMLMEGLVQREIVIQYAIAYYLKNYADDITASGCAAYIESELEAAGRRSAKEKELLEAHPEVLTLKYFLTDGGKTEKENLEDYERAIYSLKKSLNNSLDSLEASYIKESDEDHDHEEARTLPNGLTTTDSDYYTNDYSVYTGRNSVKDCGTYEKVEGSTPSTRLKAYNAFLANLQGYNLIQKEDDTSKVENLDYFYVELSSVLGQSLITKYYEDLEKKIALELETKDDEGNNYMERKYADMLATQKESYTRSHEDFETAMGSVSDEEFLLYGRKNFGYVYNILLPFSTTQEIEYKQAQRAENSQDAIYNKRREILANVKGKDLRGSWISAHDHANYSYTKNGTDYYFFEDQFDSEATNYGMYEKLTQYAGSYKYNGSVTPDGDDLKATPKAIDIDEFMSEFKSHVKNVSGKNVVKDTTYEYTYTNNVHTVDGEVQYKDFIYEIGEVQGLTATAKDYFNAESDVYKAVSAVNELMFAYSTDTGCLNTYLGYAVSPYGTDFVKEFEYAAQLAVERGVGTYVVCATDYGWHIIFASYVYDVDGEVYAGGYDHAEAETEGTFSNLFYEWVKSTTTSNYTTEEQNNVLNKYNNDDSVTLYKSRYQDLLDLDS